MIKHFIDDKNIYHILIDGREALTIELEHKLEQINLSTETEVFHGPINFLLKE